MVRLEDVSECGSEVSDAIRGWGRAGFWFGFLHILIHKCTLGDRQHVGEEWSRPRGRAGKPLSLNTIFLSLLLHM